MVEACKMVGTPARLGGALRQMLMPKLPLFCKSKTAAEHPKALAERYAGLVIKTFSWSSGDISFRPKRAR